jgi:pimeloyl-ACP methyl ester carboxylesterase
MDSHYVLTDATSSPLVVCLGGAGGLWPDWLLLAEELDQVAEVVAVQRPAAALSLDQSAEQVAACISEMNRGQAILVAHSMGGFVAKATARLQPELVSAMVLLDSSVAHPHGRLEAAAESYTRWASRTFRDLLDRSRLRHRIGPVVRRTSEPALGRQHRDHRDLVDQIATTQEHWEMVAADLAIYEDWNDDLLRLREQLPLPSIPIVVFTARNEASQAFYAWTRQQDSLVDLLRSDPGAPTVRHVVLHGAPHLMQLSNPHEIATVVLSLIQ